MSKIDDHVFLLGRPPLAEFLGVVKAQLNFEENQLGELSNEWRAANSRVESLQKSESGIADNLPATNLSETLNELAKKVSQSTIYRQAFSIVPPVIGMVELDKLVVFQKHINLNYVEQIKRELGENPSEETIFKTCLQLDETPPAIASARVSQNAFVFMSPSADIRVLDAKLLSPNQVSDNPVAGPVSDILGISVGAGPNCLNAMRVNNRLILNNGSHRAYALRALGITHAPCIIQNVTSNDELEIVATAEFKASPAAYSHQPRPSLLKDYFNKDLIKILPVKRKQRQIKISYNIEILDVPDVPDVPDV